MTRLLRIQLQTARAQYHAARYPGDLAEVLPSSERISPSRHFWRSIARASLVAAALALIVLGHVMLSSGDNRAWASSIWNPDLSGFSHLTWHSAATSQPGENMMGATSMARPAPLPDWLKPIEKPLADSGRFIVNVGKDLAHQADALVHMM